MISRIVNYPKKQSFFVLGPRGCGKTSWIKNHFKDALYIDLLDSDNYQELLASPKKLESRIPSPPPEWVVIDEIQKIPELLNEVHRLIELKKIKFILTGSSARKLKKIGTNLLGGRAIRLEMTPFHSIELGERFDLIHALKKGMLPFSYLEDQDQKYLKTYVSLFLKEEIQQEAIVRNLPGFSRFLEAASFSQASLLSISKIADDCHIGRKAAEAYFQILDDFLIAKRVQIFKHKVQRKIVSHPKFYFFDVGVYQAIRPKSPLIEDVEIKGAVFETFIFQELEGLRRIADQEFEIFYWRTQKGNEVDFIIYGENVLTAIEVKSSVRLRSEDFDALELFGKDYPQAKKMLVYAGDRAYSHNGIDVCPIDDFLKNQMKLVLG